MEKMGCEHLVCLFKYFFKFYGYLCLLFSLLLLFAVLTQDEWNEKQRSARKPEFSWCYGGTSTHENRSTVHQNDDENNDDDDNETVGPSLDMFLQPPNNPNKQTTITPKSSKQIYNELDNEPVYPIDKSLFGHIAEDGVDNLDNIPLPSEHRTGTEIAPPPTYEYYGPSSRGQRVKDNVVSVDEMQNSISKGLNNANIRNKSKQIRGFVDDDGDDNDDDKS